MQNIDITTTTGEWIVRKGTWGTWNTMCSVCNAKEYQSAILTGGGFKYCPTCGARMLNVSAETLTTRGETGKWKVIRKPWDKSWNSRCSACNEKFYQPYILETGGYNYCPQCGARMVE